MFPATGLGSHRVYPCVFMRRHRDPYRDPRRALCELSARDGWLAFSEDFCESPNWSHCLYFADCPEAKVCAVWYWFMDSLPSLWAGVFLASCPRLSPSPLLSSLALCALPLSILLLPSSCSPLCLYYLLSPAGPFLLLALLSPSFRGCDGAVCLSAQFHRAIRYLLFLF